jgi:hypothetical protein
MSHHNEHFMDRIRRLPQDMKQYVEKRLELFMIETGETLANILAKGTSVLVTGLIVLNGVLFLLFALAYFLGDLLNSMALGFSIVAILLFTIALIVYLIAPEAIEEKVRRRIADQFMDTRGDAAQTVSSGAAQSSRPNPIFNGNASPADKARPGETATTATYPPQQQATDFSDDPEAIRRAVDAMADPARTDTEHRNRER